MDPGTVSAHGEERQGCTQAWGHSAHWGTEAGKGGVLVLVSRGSSRSERPGPHTPPAKVTHGHRAPTGPPGARNPLAEAAAAAVTGDISFHEYPGFKVSAGVREEEPGEARWVGERCRAGPQERTKQPGVGQSPQLRYVVLMGGEHLPQSHSPQGSLGSPRTPGLGFSLLPMALLTLP